MHKHEKPRHAANDAVAALRKAMGLTQTSFAVEVMKVAISTLARYETSTPPRGDVLLQLASIAGREALECRPEQRTRFVELRDTFRVLYFKDSFEEKGFNSHASFSFSHLPGGGPDIGFLVVKTETDDERIAADSFLTVFLRGLRNNTNPGANKTAVAAMKALRTAANKILNECSESNENVHY